MKKYSVKDISLASTFAALSIILDVLSVRTDSSKYTLYGLPLLFAGILFGPWVGLLTGLVSGFLSQLLTFGLSITTPLWMIAPMLWGFISGLLFHNVFKKKESPKNIVLTVILTSVFVTLTNTLALYLDGLIYHYPTPYVIAQLGVRLITSIMLAIIYSILIQGVLPKIKNLTTNS